MRLCYILSTILCLLASPVFIESTEALSVTPITDQVPIHPKTLFCEIILSYVGLYGEAAAEKWAREHKWSSARIAEAKRCRRLAS